MIISSCCHAGEGATPRSSRLSAQGRNVSFPYDDVSKLAEPNQSQQSAPVGILSSRPIISNDCQDGYADSQGQLQGLACYHQPGLRNAEALQSILVAAGQLVHTIGTKQIMLMSQIDQFFPYSLLCIQSKTGPVTAGFIVHT